MALYSYKGQWPTQLPNRIKLSDGTTRTDKTTFTEEMIADAGWVEVEYPPVANYPNKLEWSGTEWVVREPNTQEVAQKWKQICERCEQLLFETDYKVIKAVELGEEVDPYMKEYRQALRDLYNNVNDVDPWTVQYPMLQSGVEEETIEIQVEAEEEQGSGDGTI